MDNSNRGFRLLSVVLPAWNESKRIGDCLHSLKDQDYEGKYEIIVADNGSTDNTADIARSLSARVIDCSQKKGVAFARQAGADAALGEIILPADADTIYPRNWLSGMAGEFAASPDVVAVLGRYVYFDPPYWARVEYFLRYVINLLCVRLFGRPLVVSAAVFAFRRSAFEAANGYRGMAYSPDQYGIAARLAGHGTTVYAPHLCAATSARSVQRFSLAKLMADGVVNISRWFAEFSRFWMRAIRLVLTRTPARRIATALLPVALLLAILGYGYFDPASPVFGQLYSQVNSSEKVIALTFDDGPNEPYTSEILDILAKYNVKATFFVIGKNVELEPATARRILAEGHVIGNHSYSHNDVHALTDFGAKDLVVAQAAIYNNLGVMPHLYRPPNGKKSPWELQSVKEAGMVEVTWSVSVNESLPKFVYGVLSSEAFAHQIVGEVKPGKIIQLRDGNGLSHGTVSADKTITVEALPTIIESLQAEGYRFVTVPELLNVPAYNNWAIK